MGVECVVEVEEANGAKMKMQVRNAGGFMPVELVKTFFKDEPMIQITSQMRILVAVEAVDFRKGIDGLVGLCRQSMKVDPFLGAVYVFRNRTATAIKILTYDGQGFWLCQKRLSQRRFRWWPSGDESLSRLAAHQLQLLLWGGNLRWWAGGPFVERD